MRGGEFSLNQNRYLRTDERSRAISSPKKIGRYEIRLILPAQIARDQQRLWSQPLDSGPPKQLTKFINNDVGIFDFSRDGKTIVFTRGTVRSDVVLISDLR